METINSTSVWKMERRFTLQANRAAGTMLLMIILLLICSGHASAAKMYFKSGFEPGTVLEDYHRFRGKDNATGYSWDKFGDYIPSVKEFNFKYWGGKCPEDAYVDIVPDPDGVRGKVLHAQVNSDSGGGVRCRTEGSMYFDKSFDQLCVRYKYEISDAYQAVLDNNIKGWWLISELWTTGPEHDRASMPLYISRGDGCFHFCQTLRAKKGGSFRTQWSVENREYRIPLGKWVEVVHMVKRGPAGIGRVYLKFDGHVVFDIRDKPIVWDNRQWKYWSCLKLYEDVTITDFLGKRGTAAQVWYDDFEVWSDIPMGSAHSALPTISPNRGKPLDAGGIRRSNHESD